MDLSYSSKHSKDFWVGKNISHFKIQFFKKGSPKGKILTECAAPLVPPGTSYKQVNEKIAMYAVKNHIYLYAKTHVQFTNC